MQIVLNRYFPVALNWNPSSISKAVLRYLAVKQYVFNIHNILKLLQQKCRTAVTITKFEAVMCNVVEMLQIVPKGQTHSCLFCTY